MAARRVKVINLAHYGGNSESWGISLTGYSLGCNSSGNIIEECEVSHFVGGGISALNLAGCSGIMRNNRVYLGVNNGLAIDASMITDCLIDGNYIDGASVGFYSDTHGWTNVTVVNNTFKDCILGVMFNDGNKPDNSRNNIIFANNTILLSQSHDPYYHNDAFYFLIYGGSPVCTNIAIIGNHVGINGEVPGPGISYNFIDAPYEGQVAVNGLIVANNTVDARFNSYLSGCTGLNMYFNFDLNGNLRSDLDTMGFSTMTSFGKSFLASPNYSTALTSLGLPANPAVILTNNQSQPVTFNTNVTVNGTLNYSNMVAQLIAGTGVTASTINTPTGQVVTVNANVPVTSANEFWISTNTATANLGTLSDPFDGSTQVKFDSAMDSLPPNSTIHILAGTYQTLGNLGGWGVKSAKRF